MSAELQARARIFLDRSIPAGIDYVPSSIAEQLIAAYANRGSLSDDTETTELLALAGMEASSMAARLSDPTAAAFFRETSAIIEEILAELI